MMVPVSDRKSGPYTATAGQTVFNYKFPILAAAHLKVLRIRDGAEAELELDVDYAVTGVGEEEGGTIVLAEGAEEGDVITLYGRLPIERAANFPGWRSIPNNAIDQELDRMTIALQEMSRDVASTRLADLSAQAAAASADAAAASEAAVADIAGDVATVAGIAGDVTAVAGIAGDVTAVVARAADIGAAAAIDSDISTVAANIADIQAAPAAADLAAAWAEGAEPGGAGTKSAKEYAQDAAATLASAAKLDGGNALTGTQTVTSGVMAVGTDSPASSAVLEVASTSQGLLPPRMTTAERDAIVAPAQGLTVYNADDGEIQSYDGTAWVRTGQAIAAAAEMAAQALSVAAGIAAPSQEIFLRIQPIAQLAALALDIAGNAARSTAGGRAWLAGGTLARPALKIGTVGIYSSAADTLSIAIGGVEIARFTASGLRIKGAVTEDL